MTITNDQIRTMADGCKQYGDSRVGEMLEAWLTERQAARDGVTDAMVEIAARAYTDVCYGFGQPNALGKKAIRAALQSIAPMLASAPISDEKLLEGCLIAMQTSQYQRPVRVPDVESLTSTIRGFGYSTYGQSVELAEAIHSLLSTSPQPQQAVPDGWTDRHQQVQRFALQRFVAQAHDLANVAAQDKHERFFKVGSYKQFLADAKTAEECLQMLSAAPAYNGKKDNEHG